MQDALLDGPEIAPLRGSQYDSWHPCSIFTYFTQAPNVLSEQGKTQALRKGHERQLTAKARTGSAGIFPI